MKVFYESDSRRFKGQELNWSVLKIIAIPESKIKVNDFQFVFDFATV